MGLNQQIGTKSNLPGVDTPYKGDMEKLVRAWARDTAATLAKNADRANYTGGEITWSVSPDGITFEFPAYMRYRDMKLLFWSGLPNIDAIEAWVRKKGLREFAYVPGYGRENLSALGSAPNAERRIAYGVAMSMASRGEPVNNWAKYKRRKIWQNPKSNKKAKGNLGTSIGHLVKLVEEELAAIIPNAIAYTFSQTT